MSGALNLLPNLPGILLVVFDAIRNLDTVGSQNTAGNQTRAWLAWKSMNSLKNLICRPGSPRSNESKILQHPKETEAREEDKRVGQQQSFTFPTCRNVLFRENDNGI